MAKRVFFSFDYQDVIDFRANVVRNHWITKPDKEDAGFFDASIWESEKRTGDVALKYLIDEALQNTSVTVVLIGSKTYARRWVRYEIMKSLMQGNHIFGVHINSIKDKYGKTKPLGLNPLKYLGYQRRDNEKERYLCEWKEKAWIQYYDYIPNTLKTRDLPRGKIYPLSSDYPVYDWVTDNGYHNFARWVE
jgi:hypothetical protein